MKNLIFLLLTVIVLSSCTTSRYQCRPSKGSRDYAVLLPGTIYDTHFVKTKLVSVHRTMRGYKHFFVTDNGDTLSRYLQERLCVNNCYAVKIS